jgi:outer membrane autotransporter protein
MAAEHLKAQFTAQSYGGRIEGGYRFAPMPLLGITPYAAVQVQSFHTPSYNETSDLGASGYALSYEAHDGTATRGEVGARFDSARQFGNGMALKLYVRTAYAHDWVNNPSLTPTFQALPGASFTVNGAEPPKDIALASAGAQFYVTPACFIAAKFDGEFSDRSQAYSGIVSLHYAW